MGFLSALGRLKPRQAEGGRDLARNIIVDIEGLSLDALKALSPEDMDDLLAFGQPITFRMGSATILAEFNRTGPDLTVNLGHIDGGGEGVLVVLWKAIEAYAMAQGYPAVQWNIHALTCASPNQRLQRFLYGRGFMETEHALYGRVLTLTQTL